MPDLLCPLIAAILANDVAEARALIKADHGVACRLITEGDRFEPAVVHWIYKGDTALHVAAAGYRLEIAQLLLDSGADVSSALNRRHGQPLHYAADGHQDSPAWNPDRQAAMISMLLGAGADIHAQDKNGATPLHRAVRTRCAAAVKGLLDAGANPVSGNRAGSTPFHLAVRGTGRGGSGSAEAQAAQREIIKAFVAAGASPDFRDAAGKSVREWARSEWVREMLRQ